VGIRKDANKFAIAKTESEPIFEGIKTPQELAPITLRRSGRSAYTKLGSFGWLWSVGGKNGRFKSKEAAPVFVL
jgi:hypothetical protein